MCCKLLQKIRKKCSTQGYRQQGEQWCSVLPFTICVLPFHVWHPGCCMHPILYFKNVTPLLYLASLSVNSWWHAWLDQVKISQLSQANVDKDSEKSVGLWKKWRIRPTSYWVKLYKKYVQNTTNMKILKMPIAWTLKHVEQNCWQIWNQRPNIESVKKKHATENEKPFVALRY